MFDNIGEKIKKLATVVTIIGIIVSVIYGIVLMTDELVFAGLVTIVLGSLASWIGSFVLYGFGELICDMRVAAHNSYAIYTLIQSESSEEK